MYWYERDLEPPEEKEKCFTFKGTASAIIKGYVYAKDKTEAIEKIYNGEYDIEDYEFDNEEIDEIKEE